MSSVPLFMGAYYGYLQPAEKLEEWVGDDPAENNKKSSSQSSSATNRAARRALERETEILGARQMGLQLASRALGLATLGTMGSFGLIGAGKHFCSFKLSQTGMKGISHFASVHVHISVVGFYLSGCRSIGEAMSTTREWASSRTQSFEDWMGMDDRESKTHPEVVATKNMTEEEEVNYVYDRLMKEIESGSDSDKK